MVHSLKMCDNSRMELTGGPCKERVKAKEKDNVYSLHHCEGVRSWAFMDCHLSRRRLVPQQWNCFLRNTLATALALSGKEVGSGKRVTYIRTWALISHLKSNGAVSQ